MKTTIAILCFISFTCLIGNSRQELKCDEKGLKRFDELVSLATTFGSANQKFPQDGPQLKDWCSKTSKYLNEAEVYSKKCNKGLAKQVFGVFIYSCRTSQKKYCRTGSKIANQFTKAAVCYNANKDVEMKVYTEVIDRTLGATLAPDNKKIPHLCCTIFNGFGDLRKGLEKKCDQDGVNTMFNYITSLTGSVLDMLCGDYTEDSDKCQQLGLPPKKLKTQRRSKSMGLPVVELLQSFEEI